VKTGKGKILVTGSTGFLGKELVERLSAREPARVRVLLRSPSPELLERAGEVVEGSILDESAVAKALEGVSAVYHLAGRVSRNPEDGPELYRVHVQGTTLLCRAAKKAGVDRIVLSSTSGTIAVSEDGQTIPDETFPPPLKLIGKWPYYTSKLYQEQTARRECEGGPELVILNPSLLLGPGDKRLSSTEDVLKLLAGDIPVVPPGGVNFVDVRDAADAFESALARGRPGERYLLGGPNWSFETFFAKLARIGGVKGPRLKLTGRAYSIAGKAVDAFYRQWDRTPPVDRVSVEMGERFWWLHASKAERELGFRARDPYETLNETVAYVKREFLSQAILA
jgi:dihydroflavonol-4-reductase